MTGNRLAATGSDTSKLVRLALILLCAGFLILLIVGSTFDKRDSE